MAAHRQCFYCKQSFQSANFHSHLKQCPQRQKKNNPGPLQQQQPPPQYGGYGMNMGGRGGGGPAGYGMKQPMRPPMNQQMNQYGNMGNNMNMGGRGGGNPLWQCKMCSFQNSPNAQVCTMCQQGKKAQPQGPQSNAPRPMQPPMFANQNQYGRPQNMAAGGGGLPAPNMAANNHNHNNNNSNNNNNKESYWECQSCTFVNSIMSASCKICSNPQPKGQNNPNNTDNDNKSQPKPDMPLPPKNNLKFGKPPPPRNNKFSNPPPPPSYDQAMKDKEEDVKLQFGAMPPPPPQQQQPSPPPQNQQPDQAMDYGIGGGGAFGVGAQEPDDATAALIAEMMAAELCAVCKRNQGFGLPCGDNVCGQCAKKYLLSGIATMKWKKQALVCPGCQKGTIPSWILKECGIGVDMQKKLEEMQNKYMIDNDPTITSCPKCSRTYGTEQGDMAVVSISNEKGPNGKNLSYAHKMHKTKYRFRCSYGGCKAVFCSGCYSVPYHIGYTCDEYKSYRDSKKCRFCETQLGADNTAQNDITLKSGLDNVCSNAECLEKRRWSCDLKHDGCGHNCIGLMGHSCIKCLSPQCVGKGSEINDEEYCNICWVDPLFAAPCVKLACKHYFHFMCLWQKIDKKWPAARITFGFLNCPLCKKQIHHPALDDITKKYYDLKAEIQKDAIERVKIEGLQHDKRMKDANSPYYNNLPKYALDRLAFYPCSKCKKPYFGGMKACEEAGLEMAENYKSEHLVCGSCASGPNAKSCKKHGKKYITYKCKFCCSVSSWYCWGSTHFCDKCHKKQEQGDYLNRRPISELPKCPGVDKCPLEIEHPANGTAEFSLGCVVCLRR